MVAMRSPIPPAIREELSNDPFMSECALDYLFECEGRIEWQHAMTYAGKRVNELYTIVPLCHFHHLHQAEFRREQEMVMRFRIKHFHAEDDFAAKYPKSNLLAPLRYELV